MNRMPETPAAMKPAALHISRPVPAPMETIEMVPEGASTRLTITDQGAFLSGYEDGGSRVRGTAHLIDMMSASLDR
jgi:hypothetical protein